MFGAYRLQNGLQLIGQNTTPPDTAGEIRYNSSTNQFEFFTTSLQTIPSSSSPLLITSGGTGQSTQTAAFDALSPLTTAGDILYYNGTHNVRLPIGTTGQALTVVSGEPAWSSSGTMALPNDEIFVGNGSNIATAVPVSGDLTLVNTGAFTLAKIQGTTISGTTGTGSVALSVSPAFTGIFSAVSGTLTGSLTLFNTPLGPASGGTGIANNAASTIRITGSHPLTLDIFMPTTLVIPPSASGGNILTTTSILPPTIQQFTSGSGTYTLPSSPAPLYIRVEMTAGGGGGAGSGTTGAGTGGTGGNTTFGTSLLTANGGSGGAQVAGSGGAGGVGGSASISGGAYGIALSGGGGAGVGNVSEGSGTGGNNPFGGGGAGQAGGSGSTSTGINGASNSGAGGGGAGGNGTSFPGAGGGSGGYIDAIITSPSSTYAYAIGSAGSAGTAGSAGNAGGSGGNGSITVYEYYQ